MDLKKFVWEGVDWRDLDQSRREWARRIFVNLVIKLGVHKRNY
jgi:hypothetical protein